ncbi:LA2681 family HEPN domain-containing protein [Tenacibaculum maritimum]|uniref:LA2681 family HEPN domain-containing protein n=1 Tax=Tenacibaculum maritimum TaxID=107401 RepID=UPI001E4A715F|nr:LA2681 family HEPN domain-containing protein [Tenacibaculum maritimum]MCD9584772.1 hypothetical protein [Tenacibaculum maritimum]MCD9621614.1 hypothetical protein [Tenacibaculum maritimum]MCD9626819.1 hypothetical protein [Tenacibaculum maritimum]MCD9630483.1 hypothetical protein [Tenacibaculum maritimum]MCD9634302.1 hypothetical protein [Tenacibaculum maritimum]
MEEVLNDYLSITSLKEESPQNINIILGTIFEYSRELNSLESLKEGIKKASCIDLTEFKMEDKMNFYYNLSNAWSYKKMLTQVPNSSKFWQFENEELTQEILNCRKALNYSKNSNDTNRKCEILTNLANDLNHLGRYSEAIELWKKALELDDNFSMAIGNLGFGLFHYAQIIYDDWHKAYFLKEAYRNLNKIKDSEDIYDEAKVSFNEVISIIEKQVNSDFLHSPNSFEEYSLGKTKDEINYRKWCLENKLFLNPMNDVFKENIVARDVLSLPTIVVKSTEKDIYNYHSFFNQIKQEFCSARYFFYESTINGNIHFSDRENFIIDTLDYATYSFNLEKLKTSFRLFYSILDKIAYLINSYFKLGKKPFEVTFRKIWLEKKAINPKIENTQNWGLRGLYWLCRDFSEKDDLHSELEPEAKELSSIRNFIEHKSFKIIEFGKSGISEDGFIYEIQRDDFIEKTFKLMKIIRASIIYTSLTINLEEIKKVKHSKTGNIQLDIIDDFFKN